MQGLCEGVVRRQGQGQTGSPKAQDAHDSQGEPLDSDEGHGNDAGQEDQKAKDDSKLVASRGAQCLLSNARTVVSR